MFRIWGKLIKRNKILEEKVIEIDNSTLTENEKIQTALKTFCHDFDLENPMWFDKNTRELSQISKTTFREDHFIESIWFDYLELEIIDDGKKKA
ncbi:hypothetical protein LNN31_18365 [Acetobacterium wieringae]|jgi:hypothetical protein|uniref:Uncharacterized protein n=1 Tax=Acetobacterium wieringae TaxID=52694 RepID=A0A1F2PJE7_9FIRM|nr:MULTISPECIES: hypothetical protein [Acetobacterium]HAZ05749.1 hypothetical protein [Acetobacterium sp.]MEA4807302.1 hypothetical protein [Acetobacterium wieringae]OFV71453.1 hypothetical protein ACWI_10690 [Acetobacterium wieringae]OXS26641.1 MAG: hypothetical protein BI182_02735 [Acetobacterium sp. MES1]TYC83730.1 hypothetical protein FXB42_15915 [Acetobacterium wieringae]